MVKQNKAIVIINTSTLNSNPNMRTSIKRENPGFMKENRYKQRALHVSMFAKVNQNTNLSFVFAWSVITWGRPGTLSLVHSSCWFDKYPEVSVVLACFGGTEVHLIYPYRGVLRSHSKENHVLLSPPSSDNPRFGAVGLHSYAAIVWLLGQG